MVALQVTEPGSYPVKIDLAKRWGRDHTVIIGVARDEVPENHIAFRKAQGYLSRRQTTILALDGNPDKLMVRDGGMRPDGQWSREWKHTFINGVPLSHTDWRPLSLGDRIRFHIEKPQCAGYALELAYDKTDNTYTGSETINFDVVKVWESMSLATRDCGVLLLTVPHNDGIAVIQRLDETAEAILGAESGELIAAQERFAFNNLAAFGPERKRLTEHVSEAMVQSQALQGNYVFGGNDVNLRLERRPVNGDSPLFGWVTLNTTAKEKQNHQDWKSAAVAWAGDHPWLAAGVSIVVAIAVILWLLVS